VLAFFAFRLSYNDSKSQKTPFFKYQFNQNNSIVSIGGGDNMDVVSSEWILPLKDVDRIINGRDTFLRISDLEENILMELSLVLGLNPKSKEIKDSLRCSFYRIVDGNQEGVPLFVNVKYRKRGETKNFTTQNYVYLYGLRSETPEVKNIGIVRSDEEASIFLQDGRSWVDFVFSEVVRESISGRIMGPSGGCRIQGGPGG